MLKSLFAVLVAVPVITLVTDMDSSSCHVLSVLGMAAMAIVLVVAPRRSLAAEADRDFAPGLQVTIALLAVIDGAIVARVARRVLCRQRDHFAMASVATGPSRTVPAPALGVGLGQMHGPAAAWLRPRLARAGRWLLGALALLAILGFWSVLIATGLRVASAIVLATLAALAVGHLLGGPHPATRTAVAISTALRNPGLALLAAALNSAPPGVKATILSWL